MTKNFYFGDKDCYFKKQYDDKHGFSKWNETISGYIKKINESVDDRAYVIFAAGLLEKQITQILQIIFPKYKYLEDVDSYTFSMKIRMLKALNLLPNHFLNFSDLVREIRNVFAHNIDIESFEDFAEHPKLLKKLRKIDAYCAEWKENLVKSNFDNKWRNKFDDIYRLALEGLFCYEENVKALFDKIWNKEFIKKLDENNI
ncbi:MAG: hypothetical protein JEY96_19915 [Bacteroidales bacterium]|nr:hypothetical protein [Bacteroidales bacterium]